MVKTEQNVEPRAGNKIVIRDSIVDDNDNPKPLSGATVEFVATDKSFRGTKQIEKSTGGSGIEITDAANGVVEVTLDPADTDDLDGETLYYQIHVTDSAGDPSTVTEGKLEITETNISFT